MQSTATGNKAITVNLSETQGDFVMSEARYVWLIGPEREGKCLKRGTLVMMFDGSLVPVEDIDIGDRLMGPDSKPRRVTSLGRGYEEMFEIVPCKGDPFTVNGSHILSLKRRPLKKWAKATANLPKRLKTNNKAGKIVDVSVRNYLKRSQEFKKYHSLYRASVDFPQGSIDERKHMIDPYWVGLWLGDGDSDKPTITTADDEIVEYLKSISDHWNVKLSRYAGSKASPRCPRYSFTTKPKDHYRNVFWLVLENYNLLLNKHIPRHYKCNDREPRLQLLAGLIDSDGWVNRTGYQLIFKQKQLADDVAFVARSLGFASAVKPRIKRIKERNFSATYYHVNIDGACDQIPVKLKRKQVPHRKSAHNVLTTRIKEIRSLGIGEYFGFTLIESPYFLLGDFTVSHNTYAGVVGMLQHAKTCRPFLPKDATGKKLPMRLLIIRDTHANLKRHLVETIEKEFAGIFTFHDDYHIMIGPGIKADLLGMNNPSSTARIQGGQYDMIWMEEPAPVLHTGNAGISRDVFITCARRVSAGGKTPKRLQVSMNPASKDHWTYYEAINNPLKNTDVFHIKPGENEHLSKSDRDAREEAFRDRPDLAARYDKGMFADVFPGIAITPEYSEEIHMSKKTLLPIPGAQHFRFWDGGLTPVCVVSCVTPMGRWHFLDCVAIENGGMRQLIKDKVIPLMNQPRYEKVARLKRLWRDLGDDSLKNREQSDSEHRGSLIIEELLDTSYEGGIQNWDPRRESMKDALSRSPGGRPFVQVNPVVTEGEPYNRVHAALAGGYSYKVTPAGLVLRDGPDKLGPHSHVGDAISHAWAKLFFRKRMITPKYGGRDRDLKRAKSYSVG